MAFSDPNHPAFPQGSVKNSSKTNTDNIKQNKRLTMLCRHEKN